MKKLFIILCFFFVIVFVIEIGESCVKVEDNMKCFECYDSVFVEKENKVDEVKEENF